MMNLYLLKLELKNGENVSKRGLEEKWLQREFCQLQGGSSLQI
jgi:hypothetical protein